MSPSGQVYVANAGSDAVTILDGTVVSTSAPVIPGRKCGEGSAALDGNYVFVTNAAADPMALIGLVTSTPVTATRSAPQPEGVAVAS